MTKYYSYCMKGPLLRLQIIPHRYKCHKFDQNINSIHTKKYICQTLAKQKHILYNSKRKLKCFDENISWIQSETQNCLVVDVHHLDMKPPLSHLRLAAVFAGKSSSGLCKTSTRTDNSACTRGFNWSSNNDTMSWNRFVFNIHYKILQNILRTYIEQNIFFFKL